MLEILELNNIDLEIGELIYNVQERERESVPDATIRGNGFLVYIESKITDVISLNQLERHFRHGIKYSSNFFLICITSGVQEPDEIQILKNRLSNSVIWLSWKDINHKFEKIMSEHDLDSVQKFVIQNFKKCLEVLNLVGYMKITKEEVENTKIFFKNYSSLFNKICNLENEVVKEVTKSGIVLIRKVEKKNQIWWNFIKNNWKKIKNEWEEGTAVFFGFMLDEGIIEHGVHINGKIIYSSKADYNNFLTNCEFTDYKYHVKSKSQQCLSSYSSLLETISKTKSEKDIDYIIMCNIEPLEELLNKNEINYISEKILFYAENMDKFKIFIN